MRFSPHWVTEQKREAGGEWGVERGGEIEEKTVFKADWLMYFWIDDSLCLSLNLPVSLKNIPQLSPLKVFYKSFIRYIEQNLSQWFIPQSLFLLLRDDSHFSAASASLKWIHLPPFSWFLHYEGAPLGYGCYENENCRCDDSVGWNTVSLCMRCFLLLCWKKCESRQEDFQSNQFYSTVWVMNFIWKPYITSASVLQSQHEDKPPLGSLFISANHRSLQREGRSYWLFYKGNYFAHTHKWWKAHTMADISAGKVVLSTLSTYG